VSRGVVQAPVISHRYQTLPLALTANKLTAGFWNTFTIDVPSPPSLPTLQVRSFFRWGFLWCLWDDSFFFFPAALAPSLAKSNDSKSLRACFMSGSAGSMVPSSSMESSPSDSLAAGVVGPSDQATSCSVSASGTPGGSLKCGIFPSI
jgi:hypothetical protein